ncbi:MAG: hypothetical protein GY705_21065 [Bacteroidetes bacterium]|nr:hypothetical protein [Bacteroidota bacterium]
MQKQNKIKSFLRQNWIKLTFVALLVFVAFKKDLSFHLNLDTPAKTEEDKSEKSRKVKKQKREFFTDMLGGKSQGNAPTIDHFEMPYIGGSVSGRKNESELSVIPEDTKQAFIKRFSHVAVNERKKFGIPSSIILANALHQSFAGQREIAVKGNNFFALPCTSDWQGESGTYQGSCYRHYENAWMSFRDHSLYLTSGKYSSLRQLPADDYKAWAKALAKNGFSDDRKLASKLVKIIEQYQLYALDAQ